MISTTTRKVSFIGNDVTTVFPFAFKVFTSADLVVVRTNVSTGVESTLVLNSDYTVLLNADQDNNPGGTVTTGIALATGLTLTVASAVPALQLTEISNLGGFYPEVITQALDRLTILIQQLLQMVGTQFSGTLSGTVNGSNKVFTLTNQGTPLTSDPNYVIVWCNYPLVEGVGFTRVGSSITFTDAPQSGDTVFAQGSY